MENAIANHIKYRPHTIKNRSAPTHKDGELAALRARERDRAATMRLEARIAGPLSPMIRAGDDAGDRRQPWWHN